jgi:hypothetical protein
MTSTKKDSTIAALEAVHSALKPLKPDEREKVLVSVRTLLDVSKKVVPETKIEIPASSSVSARSASRPLALVELVGEKKPRSMAQFITLFAYYREKYQHQTNFERDTLKDYFAMAKERPPQNYHRDFVEAVKKGWIQEDKDNSYITSKGIEAVEAGFSGTSRPSARRSTRRAHKTTTRKS